MINLFEKFIENKFEEGLSDISIELLKLNVFSFTNNFENLNKKNTLIYGEVQSGKTNTLIGSIFDLADKGVRFFVVYTSNLKSLHLQTCKRFKLEYEKIDSSNFELFFTINEIKDFQIIDQLGGRKSIYVIFVMKNEEWTKALLDSFYENKMQNKFSLNNIKDAYIFDDEADWSFSDRRKIKSINSNLIDVNVLLESMVNVYYTPITATPYKFFEMYKFIDIPMKPTNCIILKNNWNADWIHANSTERKIYHGLEWMDSNDVFKNISQLNEETSNILLVLVSVRNYCINFDLKRQVVLINSSLSNTVHKKIQEGLINAVKNVSSMQLDYVDLIMHYTTRFEQLSSFKNYLLSVEIDENRAKQIINILKSYSKFESQEILDVLFYRFNQRSGDALDIEDIILKNEKFLSKFETSHRDTFKEKEKLIYFIIGGNKVSRGITFNNLIAMLITKNSKSNSTLLQRARWFGYKGKTLSSSMVVLASQNVISNFALVNKVDKLIRKEIEDRTLQNLSTGNINSYEIIKIIEMHKMK